LALTDSALITANTVVSNAASVMNSDAELSSKTTAVDASKQANAVFISAIQALKLVERRLQCLMLIVKCRHNHTIILIPFNSIKRLYR
jgi:hypothetical protein